MNRVVNSLFKGKWLIIFAVLLLCISMSATLALAAANSINNNFTMVDPSGGTIGGTNDVIFSWDGTKKTSVAASGQASNAIISSTCPFQGITWSAHDVAIYSAGTYTVYAGCAPGSPGCGTGTAITFTVGSNQLGAHMLFDWGGSKNIDVVDVWTRGAVFAPSTIWTGACPIGPPVGNPGATTQVWDLMSSDWNGDGRNGRGMVDGPFIGFGANFNVMAPCAASCDDNDACTTDSCDLGTCLNTSITCNDNNACTTDTCDSITGCVFTPITCTPTNACFTASCDTATGCVSTPVICIPPTWICDTATGTCTPPVCSPPDCSDNNSCTTDICNTATAQCSHAPIVCNDNNLCTTDTCNTATGCVFTTITCNDNNACTTNTCNPATGCVFTLITCNDNSVCTTDTCNTATGCLFAPISCDDSNICTIDTCDSATGCMHTATVPASCSDNDACTTDGCTANACTHAAAVCNDNNACTTDTCNTATGCIFTPVTCPTGQACNTINGLCQSLGHNGDPDGDGIVTLNDALITLNIVVGIVTPTDAQKLQADVAPLDYGVPQGDGSVDVGDVVMILRRSLDLGPLW